MDKKRPGESKDAVVKAPLHVIGQKLLDSFGASMMRLMKALGVEGCPDLERIASAEDDQTSANAILELMQSLMKRPTSLMQMQQIVGTEQINALRKVAAMAKQVSAE